MTQGSLFDVQAPAKREDVCRNNHGGNPESEAANRRTDKDNDRALILEALGAAGLRGETCDALEVALGMTHQTASARCSDLLRDGMIVRKLVPGPKKYEKRPTRTGSPAAVLVLARFIGGVQ
jgi:hypothetical protein